MEKIIDFWIENRKKIITSLVLVIMSILIFWGIYFFNSLDTKADSIDIVSDNTITKSSNDSTIVNNELSGDIVKVDIKGRVKSPGVYEVSSDNRVMDVIKKAGGLENDADTSSINLSKKVYDEMVIVIYSKKEVSSIDDTKNSENKTIVDCKNNDNKITNEACIDNVNDNTKTESTKKETTTKETIKEKININTASLDILETLVGIGEAKARAIIEYRSENGKFKVIEDITKVKGIGQALFEKIKDNITT